MRKIMIFNLKYLIFPLSIVGCINTYNVNAMENVINEEHQTSMKWNEFEKLISSFNLDNSKVEFIKNIANAASSISKDKSTWHNLSHKRLLFPRSSYSHHSTNFNTIMSKAVEDALETVKFNSKLLKQHKTVRDDISELKMTYDIEIDRLKQILNPEELLKKKNVYDNICNLLRNHFKYITFKVNYQLFSRLLKPFCKNIREHSSEMKKLYNLVVENEKNKNLTLEKLYELLEKESSLLEKEDNGMHFFTELFKSRQNDLKIYKAFQTSFKQGMCETNVSEDLLLYTKHSAWENIQNGINKDDINNNFFVSNYSGFISAIKQCHKKEDINSSQYESLLKWLLYINAYDAFNIIREELLVKTDTQIAPKGGLISDDKLENYKIDHNIPELLDYLLGEGYQNVENIFGLVYADEYEYMKDKNKYMKDKHEYMEDKEDEYEYMYKYKHMNEYLNQLPIIKEIIDNFVSLSIENNMEEKEIREEIISIITQGIYDNAYRRNLGEYENPKEEFYKMFTSEVAKEKIDKEFSVTKIIGKYIK